MPDIHTHEPDDYDNAYAGLLVNDAHWAFGTDFEDPLAGVDTTVPDDVDPNALATYCLMLGDDALVLSQRLAEWASRAPDLEEDIALSNIALDLLGQARLLLARAAAADPGIVPALPDDSPVPDEDRLAFFRDSLEFRNVRLAEVPNGDFAEAVVRVLLFSSWRLALFEKLAGSRDAVLAAVAAKGIKELAYHRDFSGRWFVTLARGTEESRRRLTAALDGLWPLWAELFETHEIERTVADAGVGVAPEDIAAEVDVVLEQVFAASGIDRPERGALAGIQGQSLDPRKAAYYAAPERRPGGVGGAQQCNQTALAPPPCQDTPLDPLATAPSRGSKLKGRDGGHTEALSRMLAEMQVVARAHPRGQW